MKKFCCLAFMLLTFCLTGSVNAASRHHLKKRAPIDGGWGAWTSTPYCSKTCGGGYMLQSRECNSPAPSNGGHDCAGSKTRLTSKSCNNDHCPFQGYQNALVMMDRLDLLPSYSNAFQTLLRVDNNGTQQLGASSTPPAPSYGTCTMTGDPHVTTFDNSRYSFYGQCVYYAVYDNDRTHKYPRFNIQVETDKSCSGGGPSCATAFTVNVFPCPKGAPSSQNTNATKIKIDALHGNVSINGRDVTPNLPEVVEESLVVVQRNGHAVECTTYCDYSFTVRWVSAMNVEIQASTSVKNQIIGMCGKWDGNPSDDFTLIDGRVLPPPQSGVAQAEFEQSYQLPAHAAGGKQCSGPTAPTQCKTPYAKTSLYCDVFRRGSMLKCNEHPGTAFYVDPKPVSSECYTDVCQIPDDAGKARTACVYYVKYAQACHCKGIMVDLSGYEGCIAPTVSLTPSSNTVWEGCPAAFRCRSTGWPVAPMQWTHNGKDIDNGSPHKFTCNANYTDCTLQVLNTNATLDQGKYTCSVNNFVGEASETSDLTVQIPSLSISLQSDLLVGSKITAKVHKTTTGYPALFVRLDLIDLNSKVVTNFVSKAPFGDITFNLKTLPTGTTFNQKYRVRATVVDQNAGCRPVFVDSEEVQFVRGQISVSIPLDASGKRLEPSTVYLGLLAHFGYTYTTELVFLETVSVDLVYINGTHVRNLFGGLDASANKLPKQVDWNVGSKGNLVPGEYALSVSDSKTGAQGKSNVFTLTHADLCVIAPSHVIFGTDVNVFVKVEPEEVQCLPLEYHLMDENCQTVIYNLTSDIVGFPKATWSLPKVIEGTANRTFRLRARSFGPGYLSACSDNTIQFSLGVIQVEIVTKASKVYVNENYKIEYTVSSNMEKYVRNVDVSVECPPNGEWPIFAKAPANSKEVTWPVGHESGNPVQAGYVCRASVRDTGLTGAAGFSHSVTVAKVCVVTDLEITVGVSTTIGLSDPWDDLSDFSVVIITGDDKELPVLTVDDKTLSYGDNAIVWSDPILPKGGSVENYYRMKLENKVTGGYGTSEKFKFFSKKKTLPKQTKSESKSENIPDSFNVIPLKSKSSGGSHSGVIAGAVVGCLVGAVLVVLVTYKLVKKRQRKPLATREGGASPTAGGGISWSATNQYEQLS
eukprot:m.306451 g.306451  ORF g.306451 m.306451 type:complete len:1145 (+) comp41248_c0_seq1:173-3607(+)